jgi:hypothetical protein
MDVSLYKQWPDVVLLNLFEAQKTVSDWKYYESEYSSRSFLLATGALSGSRISVRIWQTGIQAKVRTVNGQNMAAASYVYVVTTNQSS